MGKYIGFGIESKKTVGVRLGWVHLYFVGNKLFGLSPHFSQRLILGYFFVANGS